MGEAVTNCAFWQQFDELIQDMKCIKLLKPIYKKRKIYKRALYEKIEYKMLHKMQYLCRSKHDIFILR